MDEHEYYIKITYQLAQQAVDAGNHPFGALLLLDGEVVMTQQNQVNTSKDPTQHAELELVKKASKQLTPEQIKEAVLYTSTEPCVMCAGAIYWSGVSTLVYGCSARTLGEITGGSLVIPCQAVFGKGLRAISLIGPVLEGMGKRIHKAFWL